MGDARMTSGPRPRVQVGASALFLSIALMSGCSSPRWVLPHGGLSYQQLSADYRRTPLQQTGTLEAIRIVQASAASLGRTRAGQYLVTQTDTVVASSGRTSDGLKSWFSLFGFDPDSLTAVRKYFLCIDELTTVSPVVPRRCLFPPRRTLVFECEAMLPQGPGDAETEEARRIATVRQVAHRLWEDVQRATDDPASGASNATLSACGALMNQVFRDALLELDRFPALARCLDSDQGMPFTHTSLNGGRIRLTTRNGVVVTQVELGLDDVLPGPTLVARSLR